MSMLCGDACTRLCMARRTHMLVRAHTQAADLSSCKNKHVHTCKPHSELMPCHSIQKIAPTVISGNRQLTQSSGDKPKQLNIWLSKCFHKSPSSTLSCLCVCQDAGTYPPHQPSAIQKLARAPFPSSISKAAFKQRASCS